MASNNYRRREGKHKAGVSINRLALRKEAHPEKLILTTLLVLTFILFSGALNNRFLIGWDDGEYLSDPVVASQGPIDTQAIFSNYHLGMYQPLPVLSFVVNHRLSGPVAWPFILTNILLHLINTLLVFFLAKRWTKSLLMTTVASLLFAIHPMHVEAIAWISARSTLMYSVFFLLSLIFYDKYLTEGLKSSSYFYALTFFILSLFSKSMAATLPILLLLIDYFHGRKPGIKLFAEKIPFFVLSVIFGIVAVKAAGSFGHITALEEEYTLVQRFFLIVYGISFYLIKLALPMNLSAIYAFPELKNGMLPAYVYTAALLPLLPAASWWFARNYRKEILFGSLFFLLSISMVLPLFWSRIFIVADRYTYLPYLGLFLLIARVVQKFAGSRDEISKGNYRLMLSAAGMLLLLLFAGSYQRVRTWHDTPTLLIDVIEKKRSDADMAHGYFYLANYHDAANETTEAMQYYNLALSRNSNYLLALNNRGILHGKAGNLGAAIGDFEEAIRIKPDYAEAYYNRGVAVYQTGDFSKACADFSQALKLGFRPAAEALNRYCMKSARPDFDNAGADQPTNGTTAEEMNQTQDE